MAICEVRVSDEKDDDSERASPQVSGGGWREAPYGVRWRNCEKGAEDNHVPFICTPRDRVVMNLLGIGLSKGPSSSSMVSGSRS